MSIELTEKEARVMGCLMEKSVITPDQYPLTLNALVNACNQKSSRDPVMQLESGEVLHTIRGLQDKRLVRVEENFKSQIEKYTQRLCNTPFSDFQFDEAQFAIMTVLLLRGSRTPGELKANVGRLHTFADNTEVGEALQSLIDREGGAVVTELPRTPGRRDSEWAHLLSGPVKAVAPSPVSRPTAPVPPTPSDAALEARVRALEDEMAALRQRLDSLSGDA
jgi:uncharacterized protein YceH (UPF0502 family)